MDDRDTEPRQIPVRGRAPQPSRSALERRADNHAFAKGFALASFFGIVGPFLTWFFSPLVMLLVGGIAWGKRDPKQPRTFAGGAYLGAVVWFLINGSCSAFFYYTLTNAKFN